MTLKSQSDPYYEQYTIVPIHDKSKNESDTKMYQLLKVYETSLDFQLKDLDIKCFPNLFPFGEHGQYDDTRKIKLQPHQFIKRVLLNKNRKFR